MMTIPVNRVKLMAFSFGAIVAALAGTVFAAQQTSVFPTDFDTPFLILIYAGLILGGAGSIGGAVAGGLIVAITLDGFLRSPTQAGYIFYGVILLTLIVKVRPWQRLLGVLAATVAFGFAVHAIVKAISASAVAGGPAVERLDRRRASQLGDRAREPDQSGQHRLRALDLLADRPRPAPRTVANGADGADAVPGRVRVGRRASSPSRRSPARSCWGRS